MYLTENNIVYVPDIKEEEMDYEQIVQDLDLQNENICGVLPLQGGKKRIRLHQLTWEEKIQRKKLRNRIAAQTSRDRKKAKMDHLEETVKELKQQNEILLMQVAELRRKNELLVDANSELQKALAERPYTCTCIKVEGEDRRESSQRANVVEEQICVRDGCTSERPAESLYVPQQKGSQSTLAQMLTTSSWALWKILLLYFLSQKCWQISRKTHSWMTLKDWQQVCWKKLNSKDPEEIRNLHSLRLQKILKQNSPMILKWWGRHQKCWNPVEVS